MPRPIWRGVITFGMVSIPVGLYTATQEKDLSFNQIHSVCGSRVRYQKFCPVCDRVVEPEEIERGYEYAKGHYAIVNDEDFESLPVPSKHTISVDTFVKREQVDPVYYDKAYYLMPEEAGKKPFALLVKALNQKGVTALSKIALRNKEHMCLLIVQEGKILLETLYYPDEIRQPEEIDVDDVKVDDRELKMALSLVELMEGEFEPERFKDEDREALMERIQDKVAGKDIVEAPEAPAPGRVIDIMDALKQSVEAARKEKRKSG